MHLTDPEFPEDEEPTKPTNVASRAALLVANWKLSAPEDQAYLERLADQYARRNGN